MLCPTIERRSIICHSSNINIDIVFFNMELPALFLLSRKNHTPKRAERPCNDSMYYLPRFLRENCHRHNKSGYKKNNKSNGKNNTSDN